MFRIDRRFLQNFDWLTFCVIIILSIIGIMTIFSATRQPDDAHQDKMDWISKVHPDPNI